MEELLIFPSLKRQEYLVIYSSHEEEYYSSTTILARSHRGARRVFSKDERYANCQFVLSLL